MNKVPIAEQLLGLRSSSKSSLYKSKDRFSKSSSKVTMIICGVFSGGNPPGGLRSSLHRQSGGRHLLGSQGCAGSNWPLVCWTMNIEKSHRKYWRFIAVSFPCVGVEQISRSFLAMSTRSGRSKALLTVFDFSQKLETSGWNRPIIFYLQFLVIALNARDVAV